MSRRVCNNPHCGATGYEVDASGYCSDQCRDEDMNKAAASLSAILDWEVDMLLDEDTLTQARNEHEDLLGEEAMKRYYDEQEMEKE